MGWVVNRGIKIAKLGARINGVYDFMVNILENEEILCDFNFESVFIWGIFFIGVFGVFLFVDVMRLFELFFGCGL